MPTKLQESRKWGRRNFVQAHKRVQRIDMSVLGIKFLAKIDLINIPTLDVFLYFSYTVFIFAFCKPGPDLYRRC